MEDLNFLNYFSKENTKRPSKNLENTNTQKEYDFHKLKYSNSESDFIMKTVKEKREIIRKYLKKKTKIATETNITNPKERSGYKKRDNFKKIIRKNKLDLSHCIENMGEKNLKLFGNSRYNQKPPNLYVKDIKNKISSEKMGLVPMPSSKNPETHFYKEPKCIYSIQRNLSMARRFQYNKREELLKSQRDNSIYNSNNKYYNIVQLWWKKIPQIIDIQKLFRGYSLRKKIKPIFQLYKFMNYFERFLINLGLRNALIKILVYSVGKGKKKIDGLYISKNCDFLSNNIISDIIRIQNNFRCYEAKTKKNFLLRKKRGFIFNKLSFITKKIYVKQNKTNNSIIMLQQNLRSFDRKKNYIDKNLLIRNNGFYYYEKIYLSNKNQKVIQFEKLMKHALQCLALKKKIFYKNPNEYDIDDVNKVKYLQKGYLNHYYNNIKPISIYNFKKNICETNNIKCFSYITKEKVINIMDKLLKIQRKIKLFLKKIKSMKKQINKKKISINFLITKENVNSANCIEKISRLQNIYKSQYKKNKNNIINYDKHSDEESFYEDFTERNCKTLRQLTYRNRVPKKKRSGLYITKLRKIVQKEYNINIKNQDYKLKRPLMNSDNLYINNGENSDGTFLNSKKFNNYQYITKITKYNFDNKIKKIQKNFLKYYNYIIKHSNIYKIEKLKACFFSKYLKKNENIKQINIKFLLLTSLFIKKNIQQFGFYLLKNDKKNFEYPFCLNTINRVLKYLNSYDYKGNIVKSIFDNILKSLNNDNAIKKDFILLLNEEQENYLREINIYDFKESDCFDYICGFSVFDKKLKNEKFLNVRLNNTKFYNTNIFTMTKFIDDEFENFVKGKYCYKCYLDLNICKCSKEELTDDFEIGIDDDYNPKNSIKFFEYNKNRDKGTLITSKPKIDQDSDIITKNKLINSNIKINELIPKGNNQKNILLNSRKKFDALQVKNDKEKLRENILLRDDIDDDQALL